MTESNKIESNKNESDENLSPRTKKYFKSLVFVLLGVVIVDGYGSVFPLIILSSIAEEFLSHYDVNMQNSILALTVAISSGGMYFLFFTQYLADKIGRKKMLAISTFGMAFATLGMFLSANYVMYVVSTFILSFFVASDVWLLYVSEESDPERRARNSHVMMTGGIVGPISAVFFRFIFITDTTSNWRGVTLFPMILGFILFIFILFTVKETSKYELMKESGKEIKRPIKEDFKSIFTMENRRSYFALLLIGFISGATLTWALFFEKYLFDMGTVTPTQVSLMFLIGFLLSFVAFIINGALADKIGRKPLLFSWRIVVPIGITMWIYGALAPQNAFFIVFIGFLMTHICGVGAGGIMRITTIETLPTDRRGTGIGFRSVVGTLGGTIGLLLNSVFILIIGLGPTLIIFSFISYLTLPLILFLVKETKGVKLEAIK